MMQLGSMFISNCNNALHVIAVTNKHTAKLHHVGSLYILTYDARKLKHKIQFNIIPPPTPWFSKWSLPLKCPHQNSI